MSSEMLKAFAPHLIVAISAVLVLAGLAVRRSHVYACCLTVAALAAAAILVGMQAAHPPTGSGPLFTFDRYALFFGASFYAAAAVIAVLAYGYLNGKSSGPEEFYPLLSAAALGAAMLAASSDLVSLFLSLELMSVAMYVLIAYLRRAERSLEAGFKYLILASVGASLLLFGGALIYYATGTTSLPVAPPVTPSGADAIVWQAGMLLMLAAFAFKLGLVPLHMWTADVYEGACIPATAFVATVSKGAALAALFRLYAGAQLSGGMLAPLIALAALSMLGGNLLALVQDDLKRLLAYSSVAHMGYLMVPVVVGGAVGASASGFYFVAYAITMLAALGALGALHTSAEKPGPLSEARSLTDIRGLWRSRPWYVVLLTVALLSLAGIPLTVGFVAKFYLVVSGAQGATWGLLGALVVGSVVGLFYYLRAIYAMYASDEDASDTSQLRSPIATRLILVALGIVLVGLGLMPDALLRLTGLTEILGH